MPSRRRVEETSSAALHMTWDAARKRWMLYAVVHGLVVWSQPVESTIQMDGFVAREMCRAVKATVEQILDF